MHFTCRSFIGHNPDTSWSQYWENEPDDPKLAQTKGHLFCLINLSSEVETNLPQIGRNILNQLADLYLNYQGSISASLKHTLFIIKSNPEYKDISISLNLAAIAGETLYLSLLGPGHCLLKRGTTLSPLMSGNEDISLLQGKISNSDTLLLLSNPFYTNFSLDYLRTLLKNDQVSTIEESILSDLVNLEDQTLSSAALIVIHFDDFDAKTIPVPPIVEPESLPKPPITNPVYIPHADSPSVSVESTPTNQSVRRRRIQIIVSIVIIIALAVSIVFSYRRNQTRLTEAKYQTLKSEIQTKIDQSQKIRSLNLENSLKAAQSARDLLTQAQDLKIHSDELSAFDTQITTLLSQAGSSTDFSPSFFYDTTNIADQSDYSLIRIAGDKLYLLDVKNHHLEEFNTSSKSFTQLSTSDDLANVIDFAIDKNQIVLLYPDKIAILKDGKISDAHSFDNINPTTLRLWNGSAYLLTSDNIYKAAPNNTGFSSPVPWLKNGSSLPSNPSSLAINGSIWVIGKSGNISAYTQGVKDDYSLKVTSAVTSAHQLQTALDFENLVFIDGDNIINVYDKTGQSVSRQNFGELKIVDIALDSPGKSVFVLCTDKKIYKISL